MTDGESPHRMDPSFKNKIGIVLSDTAFAAQVVSGHCLLRMRYNFPTAIPVAFREYE